jgi:hypothetical protein
MSELEITFISAETPSDPDAWAPDPETWLRLARELTAGSAGHLVVHERGATIPASGFILVATTHPELILAAQPEARRADVARRLIPFGISRSSHRTLEMLKTLSLPAAIKGRSFNDWEVRAHELTMGAFGLYGLREIGRAIGAETDFHENGSYGYLERTVRPGFAQLLVDYLVALHHTRSTEA